MTFKGQLIESKRYFWLQRLQLVPLILMSIAFGILPGFQELPSWILICAGAVYLMALIATFVIHRRQAKYRKRKITIDPDKITVLNHSGQIVEWIPIDQISGVRAKAKYLAEPQRENGIIHHLSRPAEQHSLEVEVSGIPRKFIFTLDSHYMAGQLNKIIAAWGQRGIPVRHVG